MVFSTSHGFINFINHELSFIVPHSEQVHHWLSISQLQNEQLQVAGTAKGRVAGLALPTIRAFTKVAAGLGAVNPPSIEPTVLEGAAGFFLGGLSVRSITSTGLSTDLAIASLTQVRV